MTDNRWTPGDVDITGALRVHYAAPTDESYWDALEARILARVARGGDVQGWWSALAEMSRPALAAAAVLIFVAGAAVMHSRQLEARNAYASVISAAPPSVETAARSSSLGEGDAHDQLHAVALRPIMERPKQQALAFLLGALLVGGVLGFSADRVLRKDDPTPAARRQAVLRGHRAHRRAAPRHGLAPRRAQLPDGQRREDDPAHPRLHQGQFASADGPDPHAGPARTPRGCVERTKRRAAPPSTNANRARAASDLISHVQERARAPHASARPRGADRRLARRAPHPAARCRRPGAAERARRREARGQIRSAESSVRAARAALFPSLNLTLGQVNQSGDRLDSQGRLVPYLAPQPWTYNTGISSTLNLFDGGRRLNEIRRTRSDVGAAEANEVNQRFNISLQVKTQYYTILAARESEAAARAQLEQAQQQLRASIARTAAGVATMSDSLRSVVAVGNARSRCSRRRTTCASPARRSRGSSARRRSSPRSRPTRSTSCPRRSTARRSSAWSAQGPAVRQAEAQLTSARAARRTARTPYLPDRRPDIQQAGQRLRQALRVRRLSRSRTRTTSTSASPIRCGTTISARTRSTGRTCRPTSPKPPCATRGSARSRTSCSSSARSAPRSSASRCSRSRWTPPREDLRVQQQRYALGASTLLDVLTSQTTLDAARSALIQARQDFRIGRAQLEALVGRELQ